MSGFRGGDMKRVTVRVLVVVLIVTFLLCLLWVVLRPKHRYTAFRQPAGAAACRPQRAG